MLAYKNQIRSAFNHAANHYDQHTQLQRQVGEKLRTYLQASTSVNTVVDLGCGTCVDTKELITHYPQAHVLCVDMALDMLKQNRHHGVSQSHRLCADFDHLPFSQQSIDVIYSNMALQWSLQHRHTMAELADRLTPKGQLFFSTLGNKSLFEIRNSWQGISQQAHTNQFLSQQQLRQLLASYFTCFQIEAQTITVNFDTVQQALSHIKAYGGHTVVSSTPKGLTTKNQLQQFIHRYQRYMTQQQYPISYQIFYVTAKAPLPKGQSC